MKLSEGKLVAIEALNRIKGFEWPEWAGFAFMNHSEMFVTFTSAEPHIVAGEEHGFYDGDKADYIGTGRSHPDWKNSLITLAEFESVDGWVRDSRYPKSMNIEKIQQSSGGYKWRYKKPRNQPEKAADTSPAHSIETLIGQHKAALAATLEARRQLEKAETAERYLLESIEAWAESHGFDIRLLDESEEKPELVINDWRNLRVDVIECIKPEGGAIKSGDFGVAGGLADRFVIANFDK